jgi:hypothetical protein
MNADSLRNARNAQPFQPFAVTLADGRRFEVRHRDFLSISPNGRQAVIWNADDSWSVLEPLLILTIDYPAPSPSNGPTTPPA